MCGGHGTPQTPIIRINVLTVSPGQHSRMQITWPLDSQFLTIYQRNPGWNGMTRSKVSDLCFVPGAFKTNPIDTSRTQNVRWNNLRGWSGSDGFNRFPISGVGTHGAYCGPQSGISRQTWQGFSFHLPAHSKVRLSVTSADLTCQAPKNHAES